MTANTTQLQAAINAYGAGVSKAVSGLRRSSAFDAVIYVVIPLIAIAIFAVYKNIDAILTAVGLGSINGGQAMARGQTDFGTYSSKASKLQASLISFQVRLATLDATDNSGLQGLQDDILAAATALASP